MTALLIKRLVWGNGEQKDVLEIVDDEDVATGADDENKEKDEDDEDSDITVSYEYDDDSIEFIENLENSDFFS